MNKLHYLLLFLMLPIISVVSAEESVSGNTTANNRERTHNIHERQVNGNTDALSEYHSILLPISLPPKLPSFPFLPVGEGGFWQVHPNGNDVYFTAGNVAIGTIPQTEKTLAIKGKIHTQELIVDLNVPGPDYVFDKDYDLLPLLDVETYITYNKHLPEIPPARIMEEQKIGLSEMSMLILKKVEELTLYIIDHEKRLNHLEKQPEQKTIK